jgi:hypothetical protein
MEQYLHIPDSDLEIEVAVSNYQQSKQDKNISTEKRHPIGTGRQRRKEEEKDGGIEGETAKDE